MQNPATVRVEISGLLLAQMKYDMINSNGRCFGLLRGHVKHRVSTQTTDENEDAASAEEAVVVTAFTPLHHTSIPRDASLQSIKAVKNIIGMYSFRKHSRIDLISLREEALFESMRVSQVDPQFNPQLALLALFTSTTDEAHTINFDFVMYRKVASNSAVSPSVDGAIPRSDGTIFTRTPICIANMIESTQSNHPVFISSLSQPATFADNPLSKVLSRLDPQRHAREYESVLEDSMAVLAAKIELLSGSECELAELRRLVAEKERV
ncbi:hypothetical protein BJ741DRAFT_612270 [Chytriomyces cf. hyalinus JEL632]|nr:hypothetical protein BJ741DRAFT_612270 [Chytriomyces cf. hyalinus JEL632]